MSTLKVIIQFGCLVFLAVLTLISARNNGHHTSQPIPPSTDTLSQHWNYAQFEFSGPRIVEVGQKLYANLVYYDYKKDESMATEPIRTNRIVAADQILSEISRDGWQYVWTNGTNFLARRAEGEGRHAYFIVEYLPETHE